jgi:hypothetical protein
LGFLDTLFGRTKAAPADLEQLFRLPSAALTLEAAYALRPTGQAGVCYKAMAGRSFASTRSEFEQLLGLSDKGAQRTRVTETTDQYGYSWIVITEADFERLVNLVHVVNGTLRDEGYSSQLLCSVFAFDNRPAPRAGAGAAPAVALPPAANAQHELADPNPLAPDDAFDPDPLAPDDAFTVAMATPDPFADTSLDSDMVAPEGTWRSATPVYVIYLFKQGTFYPFVPLSGERQDVSAELVLADSLTDDLVIEKDLSRRFPIWGLPVH